MYLIMVLHLVVSLAMTWLGVVLSNINTELSRSYASSQAPGYVTYNEQVGLLVVAVVGILLVFWVINLITTFILRKSNNIKGSFKDKKLYFIGTHCVMLLGYVIVVYNDIFNSSPY